MKWQGYVEQEHDVVDDGTDASVTKQARGGHWRRDGNRGIVGDSHICGLTQPRTQQLS